MLVVMIGLGGASPVSDLVSEPMEDSMALIARLVLPACREFSGTLPALGHIFSDEGHRLPFRPSSCGHAFDSPPAAPGLLSCCTGDYRTPGVKWA